MNKFESYPAVKKFQRELNKVNTDSAEYIVGVSGGPDSMALLYMMHRFELNPIVVHCNYQLRGKASDDDQKMVEKVCTLWELECVSVKLDPDKNESENFQLWARNKRYTVFRDMLREQEADFIVTAHHEDDQLETILQKVLRGSGISAWHGMSVTDKELFRPLLKVTKSEIMKFVQDQNVPYRIDSSNEESTYARNFLRHQWFPKLQKLFPGWRSNLLKLPERAEEYKLMAETIFNSISEDPCSFRKKEFLSLPGEIQKSMIYKLLEKNGLADKISEGFLKNSSNLDGLQAGKSLEIDEKTKILSERDRYILISELKNEVHTTVNIKDVENGIIIQDYRITERAYSPGFADNELRLDAEQIKFPVTIRNWRDGDKINPLGMSGSQNVSDLLTNRKIRPSQKKDGLIIESFDGTICAIIFPHITKKNQLGAVSELVKCTNQTKNTLIIEKIN